MASIKRFALLILFILPGFAMANPNPSCGLSSIMTEDTHAEDGAILRQVKVCEISTNAEPYCEVVATFTGEELKQFQSTIYYERLKRSGLMAGTVLMTIFSPIKPQILSILKAPYNLIAAAIKGRGTTSVAVKVAESFTPTATHALVGGAVATTMTTAVVTGSQNPIYRLGNWLYESVWYPSSKEAVSAIMQDQTQSLASSDICPQELKNTLAEYYSKLRE